jgi:pimeloyl-ACP methyl ester carboxylesterase
VSSVVILVTLVYVGVGAMLYAGQRSMIYLPTGVNPSSDVAHEVVDVADAELKVWVVNPGQPRGLLYFGGNAEDVYYQADNFLQYLPGHTVYLVNYRGYGGSTGEPTEIGLFDDALALFDHLSARHESMDVKGRSLGSGVAVYLASRRAVNRTVLVTAFDSLLAVAQSHYPIFPVNWLLKDRFESVRHAEDVTAPVLLLTAPDDHIVPNGHTDSLAEALGHVAVEQVMIEGADHNNISRYPQHWDAVANFLTR